MPVPSFVHEASRVLLIDDQEPFRRLIGRCYQKRGAIVKEAGTGEQGLMIARAFQPDLIILDWVLREMSGEQLSRQLHEDVQTKKIPVVMVSSIIDDTDEPRALRSGARAFLTKDRLVAALVSGCGDAAPRSRRAKVLVAESDGPGRESIRWALEPEGCELSFVGGGDEVLPAAHSFSPDLILMNVSLPVINGVEAFKILAADKTCTNIPVILINSLEDQSGTVDSLISALSPADYLRQPFGAKELAARVSSVLRERPSGRGERPDVILSLGRIELNIERRQALVKGRPLRLPPKRFELLRVLLAHRGTVSVERIMAELWPGSDDPAAAFKTIQRLRQDLAGSGVSIVPSGGGYQLIA